MSANAWPSGAPPAGEVETVKFRGVLKVLTIPLLVKLKLVKE
jgi:hypothetical protein